MAVFLTWNNGTANLLPGPVDEAAPIDWDSEHASEDALENEAVIGANAASQFPVGMNVATLNYFSSEMPFINIAKVSGTGQPGYTGWITSGSTFDTGEEGYLQLDVNGYPTSLTASPIPSGGQKFTKVIAAVNTNVGLGTLPQGVAHPYRAGTYRLKYIGQGTVQLSGTDANVTLTNSTPNTYVSTTVNIASPGFGGFYLEITAITSNTDYPRDISIVYQPFAANYDAGSIFDPAFLAQLPNISAIRFMDWHNTNAQIQWFKATGTVTAGSTSLTLNAAWTNATQTRQMYFSDGEIRTGTFTVGSTAVTWTGGALTGNASLTTTGATMQGHFCVAWDDTWSKRPTPASMFWSNEVPLEIAIALCNTLGADMYYNLPMPCPVGTGSYYQNTAQAIFNGTGLQSGYSALNSGAYLFTEVSNEVWNSAFSNSYTLPIAFGALQWPTQGAGTDFFDMQRNWIGYQTAIVAQDFKNALTTAQFAQVIPIIGSQSPTPSTVTTALATPYWVSPINGNSGPASSYPIKAVNMEQYIGQPISNTTDLNYITGLYTTNSAAALTDFFWLMTSGGSTPAPSGHAYTSLPSNGWLGVTEGWATTMKSTLATNYPTLLIVCYEGNQNFLNGGGSTAWNTLAEAALLDSRMGTLMQTHLHFWRATLGMGTRTSPFFVFADVNPLNGNTWGIIQSILETPLPAQWQGVQTYISTG